jgi:hypothetical protein
MNIVPVRQQCHAQRQQHGVHIWPPESVMLHQWHLVQVYVNENERLRCSGDCHFRVQDRAAVVGRPVSCGCERLGSPCMAADQLLNLGRI